MELSASRHVDAGEFHSRRSFRVRWAACPRRACRRYPRDAGIAVLNGTRKINEMAVPFVAATQPRLTRTGGAGPAAGFSERALPVPGRQRHGGRGSGEDDGAQEQAIGCACAWGQGVVGVALAVGVEEGGGGGVRAVLGCPAGRAWFGAAAVNAPHLIALVRAGARFERGHLVERPEVRAACTTQPIRRNATHGSGSRAREAGAHGVDAGVPGRGSAEPKAVESGSLACATSGSAAPPQRRRSPDREPPCSPDTVRLPSLRNLPPRCPLAWKITGLPRAITG